MSKWDYVDLDAMIAWAEAQEHKAREELIAEGYDPAYLDQVAAEIESRLRQPFAAEDRAKFEALYAEVLAAEKCRTRATLARHRARRCSMRARRRGQHEK